MSKINIRDFHNENEDGAPDIVGVSTFSSTAYFVPTKGNTQQRPSDHVEVGSIRFNTDTKNLEYYRGHTIGWSQFELIDPDLGRGPGFNAEGLGARALFGGGHSPGYVDTIDFITISTLGNAIDFGDLSTDMTGYRASGCASPTRAVKIGGYMNPGTSNTICYVDIASLGNPIDFGDTVDTAGDTGSNSNGHGGL